MVILEPVLIRLFCNSLRPYIRAQAKQKDCQKNTWDQGIKKAITAEAKAALNLLLSVCEMDARYPRSHRSTLKPTKNHNRDQNSLQFYPQEAQTMPSHCSEQAETLGRPRPDH